MQIWTALILSAAIAVLLYVIILMVLHSSILEQDSVHRRLRVIGSTRTQASALEDNELSKPLYDRMIKPVLTTVRTRVLQLFPASAENKSNEHLRKQLGQAGFAIGVDEYNAIRVIVALIAILVCLVLGALLKADLKNRLLLVLGGLFASYTIMRYYLTAKITARKREIEAQLPDMLDLLSVSVEAGMGFEQAVQHITVNMEGPLIDELVVTFREMSMGRTRREAMVLLGERCDVEEVKSFTSALVQATQLGISVKNVLRAQSAAIRQARKNKVQERAAKVSTKILFPMLFFIFPVLFIVLMGPAAIKIMGLL